MPFSKVDHLLVNEHLMWFHMKKTNDYYCCFIHSPSSFSIGRDVRIWTLMYQINIEDLISIKLYDIVLPLLIHSSLNIKLPDFGVS